MTDLEHHGCGSRGEVEALAHVHVRVVPGHVALDHHSLGCSLLTNQQHSLVHRTKKKKNMTRYQYQNPNFSFHKIRI